MKPIIIALKELKSALVQIRFSQACIDSILVFAGVYLLCILINAPPLFAAIPAVLFFVYSMSHRVANVHARDVEDRVPVLQDQLSTVADNMYRDNEIIRDLQRDVLSLLKHVRVSYFIDFKKIYRDIWVIGIVCFLILVAGAWNVQFFDYKSLAKEIGDVTSGLGGSAFDGSGGGAGGLDNFTDIFGNETLAELGPNELDLEINPILSEINIEDIQDVKEREFEESVFPTEIIATTDSSFDENIPKEHREIVREYFNKIAQER